MVVIVAVVLLTASALGKDTNREGSNRGHRTPGTDKLKFDKNAIQKIMKYHYILRFKKVKGGSTIVSRWGFFSIWLLRPFWHIWRFSKSVGYADKAHVPPQKKKTRKFANCATLRCTYEPNTSCTHIIRILFLYVCDSTFSSRAPQYNNMWNVTNIDNENAYLFVCHNTTTCGIWQI